MIVALIIAIIFLITMIQLYKIIARITDQQEETVENYVDIQKKLYQYKKQVEYLSIFKKEIEIIMKEQHYNSAVNLQKKLRSAVEDIDNKLHFIK